MNTTAGALRLLLIEDNPGDARFVRELLREQLSAIESVEWVKTIAEAVGVLSEKAFDLVLMDLSLPDSTGIDGVQRIRDAAFSLPIVILSGRADERIAISAVKQGAQDYLVKGAVTADSLQRSLQYAVHRFDQMRSLAFYDGLTGLANRGLFVQHLNQTLEQAKRNGNAAGLLFVDLDGFKEINDRLGHDSGDEVLRTVARRLRECVRESDVVARLGGDEFTILLPELQNPAQAGAVATKLVACLSQDIVLCGETARVSASIGISIYPSDGSDANRMLKAADEAMYRAKAAGKNRFVFYGDRVEPLSALAR